MNSTLLLAETVKTTDEINGLLLAVADAEKAAQRGEQAGLAMLGLASDLRAEAEARKAELRRLRGDGRITNTKPARYLVSIGHDYGNGNTEDQVIDKPVSLEQLAELIDWEWNWDGGTYNLDDQQESGDCGDDWKSEGRRYTRYAEISRADGKKISKRLRERINGFLDLS